MGKQAGMLPWASGHNCPRDLRGGAATAQPVVCVPVKGQERGGKEGRGAQQLSQWQEAPVLSQSLPTPPGDLCAAGRHIWETALLIRTAAWLTLQG